MIRISQLRLPVRHTKEELEHKLIKILKIPPEQLISYKIIKQSIDARKKQNILYVYTIDAETARERTVVKKANSSNVMLTKEKRYQYPVKGNQKCKHPPVIIGSGPAGLFCAYALAESGYCPVVLERGRMVDQRKKDVELFWKENRLDPASNVQFGEGGAGAFSDGKLNTLIKDTDGRSRKVLDTFISFGAPDKIGYENKPHIGTDVLIDVIRNMRTKIIELGGQFLFETCAVDFRWEDDRIAKVVCRRETGMLKLDAEIVVLAIGHSARDTFEMLENQGFAMEAKSFAVGLRVEHPQLQISQNQYGPSMSLLGAAPYKLTANLKNHRGVYSFCMCPGGYVVNASSEPGRLAVNGMSYSKRDGANANSAIIVTVTPEDFGEPGPLSGVRFQQALEEKAYRLGNGAIPQQLLGDFEREKDSTAYGDFESCTRGQRNFAPLHRLFPKEISASFLEGMHHFSRSVTAFDRYDCILSGVESRTSSPVKIPRNEQFESSKGGVYPCGEGAGYAGGIMSAAMDGLKAAEAIIHKYF